MCHGDRPLARGGNKASGALLLAFFQQALGLTQLALQQGHPLLELLLRRQHVLDADVVVGGHTHRGTDTPERPLHFRLVHIGAYQESYRRVVVALLEQVVHGIHVEVQFAGILRLEGPGLELAHYIAAQTDVVEQQVYLAGHATGYRDLFPH